MIYVFNWLWGKTGQLPTDEKHKVYSVLVSPKVIDLATVSLGSLPVIGQVYTTRKNLNVFVGATKDSFF